MLKASRTTRSLQRVHHHLIDTHGYIDTQCTLLAVGVGNGVTVVIDKHANQGHLERAKCAESCLPRVCLSAQTKCRGVPVTQE